MIQNDEIELIKKSYNIKIEGNEDIQILLSFIVSKPNQKFIMKNYSDNDNNTKLIRKKKINKKKRITYDVNEDENSNNKIINKIDDDNDNNINESFNEFNDIECSSNKEPNENSSNKTNSKTKNKFNDKSSED